MTKPVDTVLKLFLVHNIKETGSKFEEINLWMLRNFVPAQSTVKPHLLKIYKCTLLLCTVMILIFD